MLGLSEEQAKSAITNAGRSVVLRAGLWILLVFVISLYIFHYKSTEVSIPNFHFVESRRRGKAVVCIEPILTKEEESDSMDLEETQPASKKLCADNS